MNRNGEKEWRKERGKRRTNVKRGRKRGRHEFTRSIFSHGLLKQHVPPPYILMRRRVI